jgi:hypothetical protein
MPEDVNQTESSPVEPEEQDAAPTVTGDEKADRPLQNHIAEFNRKYTKVERQQMEMNQRLDQIAQMLLSQHQIAQTPAPTPQDTDEMLWSRAQAGDRLAFEEYQRRIARREVQQDRTVNTRAQTVQAQMYALTQRYPVLNDSSHPLSQKTQYAYQLLVRSGYPASGETLLQAAMTAIADSPDLVADMHTKTATTRDAARRSATSLAQSGHTGATVRNEPAPAKDGVKLRAGEADLARRYGLSPDKAKAAKERFLERQAKGQSALGAVSGFVREDDF